MVKFRPKLINKNPLKIVQKFGTPDLAEKMSAFETEAAAAAMLKALRSSSEIKFLLHGDAWFNNFLFRSVKKGVDVKITIFGEFCQFSVKHLAFFSKTNVMIKFLQKLA
jgi:hypothetical protein